MMLTGLRRPSDERSAAARARWMRSRGGDSCNCFVRLCVLLDAVWMVLAPFVAADRGAPRLVPFRVARSLRSAPVAFERGRCFVTPFVRPDARVFVGRELSERLVEEDGWLDPARALRRAAAFPWGIGTELRRRG